MKEQQITKKSYDATALEYSAKVAQFLPKEEIEKFFSFLSPQAKILDIGCGCGRDAKQFSDAGFQVIGIDFSEKMIEIAKQRGLKAEFFVMDIESASFAKNSFGGVWAGMSLLHIPKDKLSLVLKRIYDLLKRDGLFYLSLKKGHGEGIEKDDRYGGREKFWSYFTEQEIQKYLTDAGFTVLECNTLETKHRYQTHPILKIFSKKR